MKPAFLPLLCFFAFSISIGEDRNILLLISDNHTWTDVGCYGHPSIQTPNLDKLASEGIRFEHAFATTASCGPSRAVMYTGLLTHSNGQYAHPHREHNQQLRADVFSVFSMLKDAGYRTGLIGKDHIKPMEKYPLDYHPRNRSRDVVTTGKQAMTFLEEKSEDPFFLVVSFNDPHPIGIPGAAWGVPKTVNGYEPVAYDPKDAVVPPFLPDTANVREGIAGYYQQISRMDHGVGIVLSELERTGYKDNTLVIFIADHGTSEPGAMGTHYEPGVRVPFIVRAPGVEKPLSPNRALVTFTDLTPTFLDWAGVTFDKYPLHGRSILPILDQENLAGWDEALLSHVGHDIFAYYPMRTLRGRKYKLIWNLTPGTEYPLPIDTVQRRTWAELRGRGDEKIGSRLVEDFLHRPRLELYDLETDPWETKNLADDPELAKIREEMVARLMGHLEKQKDPWIRKYHPMEKEQ